MSGERVLENYWISTCSWRVRMVLNHKGLDYKYVCVHLHRSEDDAPEYINKNPSGVPTLTEADGTQLTQSMAIMEYLEEKYPEQSVMPKDPVLRAKVRGIAEEICSGIQPLQNMCVGNLFKICKPWWPAEKKNIMIGAKQMGPVGEVTNIRYLRDVIIEKMQGVDNLMSRAAGTHSVGDSFTIADAALIPQCYAAQYSFGIDLSQFPTIYRVMQTLKKLPCALATEPDVCPDAANVFGALADVAPAKSE